MLSMSTSSGDGLGGGNGAAMSPAQKWIGGGLIALVLLGLLVAFVASPMTAPDAAPRTAGTTTLNADTGADTTVATAAFAAQSDAAAAPVLAARPTPTVMPHTTMAMPSAAAAAASAAEGSDASATPRRPVMRTAVIPSFSGATPISAVEEDAHVRHTLTEANNGEVVHLRVGEKVTIRLKENRTTGYGWKLENPTDPTKQGVAAVPPQLQLVQDKSRKGFAKNAAGKALVGVPGQHVFTLKGVSAGNSQVCATYRRPWLSPQTTEPAQTYCVKLEVTDK